MTKATGMMTHSKLRSGSRMGRAAWVLLIVLSAIGCERAEEQASPHTGPDSAQVPPPGAMDTTREAPEPAPEVALRTALEQLLRGSVEPQSEHTWFSSKTAGALRSVSVDSAGHAIVDFEDLRALIPNASTSAGSAILLEDLNSTVFSVDEVISVDYLMDGSCDRFWEWLQYRCQTVHRPGRPPKESFEETGSTTNFR